MSLLLLRTPCIADAVYVHSTAHSKQQAIHVLAPNVPEPELPGGHPKIAYGFTWAAGVPEGCITYKDRYDKYLYDKFVAEQCALFLILGIRVSAEYLSSGPPPVITRTPTMQQRSCACFVKFQCGCSGRGWNPNAEISTSNYTAIMRVHHGLRWTEDLRLMVRAYMVECRNAGLHFWLLHQVSRCLR